MSQNQPEALKQTLMGFPMDGIFSDSSGSDEEGKSKRVSKGFIIFSSFLNSRLSFLSIYFLNI